MLENQHEVDALFETRASPAATDMDDALTGESYSGKFVLQSPKKTPAASKKTIVTNRKELLRTCDTKTHKRHQR